MVKKTALFDVHVALGAKMVPFAGYEMPVRYTGDKEEHMVVRQKVGMFDVSHMGEFIVRGPKALELIQKVTSNDASKLFDGKAQYSCFPNETGGIVDDCIVYKIVDDQYMIVVNASNMEKDWEWVNKHNTMGAEILNISEETSLIAVSGPYAAKTVQKLTQMPVEGMDIYCCMKGEFNGREKVLVATTGYTGEKTYEIFFKNEDAVKFWNDLMEAGKEFGIQACGLGSRDTLRLEMGYMLYGNDIDDTTSPYEAPLAWITKPAKGDFVGKDVIMKGKEAGIKRKLVGFVMEDRGIPRHGYELASDGKVVGVVTSGSISPITNQGIGMGYVPAELSKEGGRIDVVIRGAHLKAKIVKPPFIQK